MTAALMVAHQGGCHCGAVRFEVTAPAQLEVDECNCSICTMTGFLHLIVPRNRFRLLKGADALVTYTFNTGVAQHYFCRHCGIKSFYVPRSNPDGYSVNARCLEPQTITGMQIALFDDTQREAADAAVQHRSKE
jgi:hypothetical protein